MKTLIFVHGGESFDDEESYLDFLRGTYAEYSITPWEDREKIDYRTYISRRWVGGGGQVYYPTMPNKLNARYGEWKIVFDGLLAKIKADDEITFFGTSLGGCFLLKYFSDCSATREDETIQVSGNTEHGLLPRSTTGQAQASQGQNLKINQIHLLAACISEGDFTAPDNYEYLQNLGNRVHIWHAEDDAVVPFATAEELSRNLPGAETHFFTPEKGYGHFHGVERIPELEEVIFL